MAKGKYQEWITKEGLLKIEGMARDGLTDKQIAHNIGISEQTLNVWKKKYPSLFESLKKGKEIVDRQVENALLKRALGYEYDEDKYITVKMSQEEYFKKQQAYINEYKVNHPEATLEELNRVKLEVPKEKLVLAEKKIKHIVPDTTAQIFWLKNRKPAEWRDKTEVNVTQSKSETVEEMEAYLAALKGPDSS